MDNDDRRLRARYSIWFPMKVENDDGGEAVAISRNVSEKGVLMATAAQLSIGAPVTITFRLSAEDPSERTTEGVIVRHEENKEDPDGLWPHRVAVEFDEALDELEPLLKDAAAREK